VPAGMAGRPAGGAVRIGPALPDQVTVPAQHSGGLDEEPAPASSREQPPQASEQCSVCRLQRRAMYLAPKHRNFVAQHDDLDREIRVLAP